MIWILGSGVVCCVAGVTIRWSSGEACGMALSAYGGDMNAGKREVRGCMVKVSIQPVIRVVAHGAVNRVLLGFMVLRSVVLYLVTGDTISWRIQDRSLMT